MVEPPTDLIVNMKRWKATKADPFPSLDLVLSARFWTRDEHERKRKALTRAPLTSRVEDESEDALGTVALGDGPTKRRCHVFCLVRESVGGVPKILNQNINPQAVIVYMENSMEAGMLLCFGIFRTWSETLHAPFLTFLQVIQYSPEVIMSNVG